VLVFGHSQGFGSLYNYDSGCLPKISCDFTCVHHESKRYRVQVEVFKLIFLHVQECWLVGVLNAVFICNSLENQKSKTWWSLDSVREYNVKSFAWVWSLLTDIKLNVAKVVCQFEGPGKFLALGYVWCWSMVLLMPRVLVCVVCETLTSSLDSLHLWVKDELAIVCISPNMVNLFQETFTQTHNG
jgi:hypothetical protein